MISTQLSNIKKISSLLIFILVIVGGCTNTPPIDETPVPEIIATPTEVPAPLETSDDLSSEGPVTLQIWVPPEFNPASDSPAGKIFQSRLDEFVQRRSNIHIETRVKAVEGPGGIVNSLSTAGSAAPLALPDLVALPRDALEHAAIKGLIHPFDGLTEVMDDPDWYEYARQISYLQSNTFGIPFAGNALVLVYRSTQIETPPADSRAALDLAEPLVFPASDPDSFVTLLNYQSIGGEIVDDEGRPQLDSLHLTQVLTYYHQASMSSLMPFWLTQYETDQQVWDAYLDNQTNLAISWASRYLQNLPPDSSAAVLPTSDGNPYAVGMGWAWALAGTDPDQQALSAELAEFLTTGEFLAEWTAAAGYLPARPSSAAGWSNMGLGALVDEVSASMVLIPSSDVLNIIGPVLQQATVDVLKEQADPISAAENAAAALISP